MSNQLRMAHEFENQFHGNPRSALENFRDRHERLVVFRAHHPQVIRISSSERITAAGG